MGGLGEEVAFIDASFAVGDHYGECLSVVGAYAYAHFTVGLSLLSSAISTHVQSNPVKA